MSGGSILALIGSALALLGPIILPFIFVDEEEIAFQSYEVLTGQASLVMALAMGALSAIILQKRKQKLGWIVSILSLAQIAAMVYTYQNVWTLTPCAAGGLSLCDATTGGLIDQTLVTLDWGLALVVFGSVMSVFGGLVAVAAHPEYEKSSRFLKVMLTWEGTIIYEKVMFEAAPVTIGEQDNNTFQLAAKGLQKHTLFKPATGDAWTLDIPSDVKGQLKIGGEAKDPSTMNSVEVKRGDAGVLSFENDVDVVFAFTGAEAAVIGGSSDKGSVAMAVSFAICAALMLAFLTTALLNQKAHSRKAVEENLERRSRELIEVTLEEQEQSDEEELEGEDEDTTAKKASGEEGKFGDADTDPNKQSKVPKLDGKMVDKIDVKNLGIAKVLGGQQALTGALGTIMAGDTGALNSKMAVAMSGEGGELVIGHGSGGMGFRGTGSGGGGTGGYGRIHGLGAIDTGGGTGRNANIGIGRKKRKKVAKLRLSGGRSSGGCDKGDIAKNVRRRAAALRACYERQLMSKPNLKGKVTVQWTINQEGKVTRPKTVTNTIKNASVTDCVMRTIKRIRFKKPEAGICVIQWPFVFAPG
ncbi:MAG: AgmX/PglI C-terminal domain-containing protein [Myxococcales bacterium]|nr:AgmX/PglI C-terminal domain-containing protein [Myxococcales bacterium]